MEALAPPSNTPFAETVYTDDLLKTLGSRFEGREQSELIFELGAWCSGLISFINVYDRSISDTDNSRSVDKDRSPEFKLTHDALVRIADLVRAVRQIDREASVRILRAGNDDIETFASMLEQCIVLNSALSNSRSLGYAEWKAWKTLLAGKMRGLALTSKLEIASLSLGSICVPSDLREIVENDKLPFGDRIAIGNMTSRLGRILRSLQIIGNMLEQDEPLKPTVLLFCSVYEQTRGMIEHVDTTLSRVQNKESDLFALLDGASYMASIELKKAYFQELTGIVGLRPAPSVFARVETAHALLNDSFQQILTGFARIVRPGVEASELFPEFSRKFTESLTLRNGLATVLKAVHSTEDNPDEILVDRLRGILTTFLDKNIGFLFYKDREAFERFCEEVSAVDDRKELVPVLHRFAAYVETLLRQVNMRAVLINHPYESI